MPVDIAPTPGPEALVHVVLPTPIAFPPMAHLPPRLAGLENEKIDRGNAQEMLRLIAANATLKSDNKVNSQEIQHVVSSLGKKEAYIAMLERQLQEKTQENASLHHKLLSSEENLRKKQEEETDLQDRLSAAISAREASEKDAAENRSAKAMQDIILANTCERLRVAETQIVDLASQVDDLQSHNDLRIQALQDHIENEAPSTSSSSSISSTQIDPSSATLSSLPSDIHDTQSAQNIRCHPSCLKTLESNLVLEDELEWRERQLQYSHGHYVEDMVASKRENNRQAKELAKLTTRIRELELEILRRDAVDEQITVAAQKCRTAEAKVQELQYRLSEQERFVPPLPSTGDSSTCSYNFSHRNTGTQLRYKDIKIAKVKAQIKILLFGKGSAALSYLSEIWEQASSSIEETDELKLKIANLTLRPEPSIPLSLGQIDGAIATELSILRTEVGSYMLETAHLRGLLASWTASSATSSEIRPIPVCLSIVDDMAKAMVDVVGYKRRYGVLGKQGFNEIELSGIQDDTDRDPTISNP